MKSIKLSIITFLTLSFALVSCSDLEEKINDGVVVDEDNSTADVDALLTDAYRSLQSFHTQDQVWALDEHTSDEVMGPTRGTDWDDNGIWRVLHDHTWDPEHNFIRASWNALGRGLYLSNNILQFDVTTEQEVQARFLRAFYVYKICDLFGQVPMREPGEDVATTDPTVMGSSEAITYAITELEAIMPNLPDNVPAYQASKNAARGLLAKMYLNRDVYEDDDRIDPQFKAANMDKVIQYCDAIIGSGNYMLDSDYYDNFRPNNDQVSEENIWTNENIGGVNAGNVRSRWFMTLHYNQEIGGWNGFCTIADFYDKFDDPNDVRLTSEPADFTPMTGIKAGFLEGQQFNSTGDALEDRKGNPLAFTREVNYFETGDNLEVTGVRAIKYIPDMVSGDASDNDYVMIRYADVLLMKAEAIARGGAPTMGASAASLVNDIRTARGTSADADGSLTSIYDERGFELWWEGHRRQDMIRFGTFTNDTWTNKTSTESFRVLFPIPAVELSANPMIQQNNGY